MSGYDEMCDDWVQTRKHENDDGTWQVCHPVSGELEDEIFITEESIDDYLWSNLPDQIAVV